MVHAERVAPCVDIGETFARAFPGRRWPEHCNDLRQVQLSQLFEVAELYKSFAPCCTVRPGQDKVLVNRQDHANKGDRRKHGANSKAKPAAMGLRDS